MREICKLLTQTMSPCRVLSLSLLFLAAAFFRQNPACTHRLVPWLTREFRVLLGTDHVQFMIQLVLSLISKYDKPPPPSLLWTPLDQIFNHEVSSSFQD